MKKTLTALAAGVIFLAPFSALAAVIPTQQSLQVQILLLEIEILQAQLSALQNPQAAVVLQTLAATTTTPTDDSTADVCVTNYKFIIGTKLIKPECAPYQVKK